MIEIGSKVDESSVEKYESATLYSNLVDCYTSGTTGMPKGVVLN